MAAETITVSIYPGCRRQEVRVTAIEWVECEGDWGCTLHMASGRALKSCDRASTVRAALAAKEGR